MSFLVPLKIQHTDIAETLWDQSNPVRDEKVSLMSENYPVQAKTELKVLRTYGILVFHRAFDTGDGFGLVKELFTSVYKCYIVCSRTMKILKSGMRKRSPLIHWIDGSIDIAEAFMEATSDRNRQNGWCRFCVKIEAKAEYTYTVQKPDFSHV